jgi:hypothetical protein
MAKRTWLPIALSGAGLLGLLGSWACFPPLMVAGGVRPAVGTASEAPAAQATRRPASPPVTDGSASPTVAEGAGSPVVAGGSGSTAPTGTPSEPIARTTAGPSAPAASPAAGSFGDLTPVVARTYAYRTTGAGAGQLFVAVTAVAGLQVGYRSQTVPAAGSPPPPQTGTATLTNGVYWIFPDRPNPVTALIATYPTETVAVPAGTGIAAKVVAGPETYWFVGGIIVKAVTAAGTTELQAIQ